MLVAGFMERGTWGSMGLYFKLLLNLCKGERRQEFTKLFDRLAKAAVRVRVYQAGTS